MPVIFGDFMLDRPARQLRRGAEVVHLEPKAFELLDLLIGRRPEAVSKGDIKDCLWPGTFVSESSLMGLVSRIRQALGDDPKRPRFIRTVHGFGYAFSGEVSERSPTKAGDARPAAQVSWEEHVPPLQPGENVKTLAVLPFESQGGPEDYYFAEGIADEVRGKLAGLPALQVIARGSSNEYKNTTKTMRQIAAELGAQYLLTATVRWDKKAGALSRVRVSPELVQVAEGAVPRTRWQRAFEAVLSDVFQVQADIAEQVAQALDVALGEAERRRVVARPTGNLAAYEAYLRGNDATGWFASTSAADLRRAIKDHERAVALDAGFALAWAQLSRGCSTLYFNGIPDPSYLERAKLAAERALALNAALPSARLALGDYYSNGLNDWSGALEQYAFGLQAAPRDADLLAACAVAQQRAGRWQESLALLRKAQEFDPRSAATARRLTVALLFLRRYTEAHAAADRAVDLAHRKPNIIEDKVAVFLAQGDLSGARAALEAAPREVDQIDLVVYMASYGDLFWVLEDAQQELLLRLTPDPFGDDRLTWGLALAQTAALRGDAAAVRNYAEEARRAAKGQIERAPEDAQRRVFLGVAHAYLGQKAEAVREGERALALLPVSKDAYLGPYIQHQLARIYLRVGEPEKALDQLEPLLKIPYYLSPGWLRIDPEWTPLHENPRFQNLVGSGT